MASGYSPRLSYLDLRYVPHGIELWSASLTETLELIRSDPETLLQTRTCSLESAYSALAFYQYALGYPLEEVRGNFSNAARASLKIFELRGTEEAFQAYVLTYDPNKKPSDPGSHTLQPLRPPGTKDHSVTNSKNGYLAVCEALIAREDELAAKLASLIWDPPNAKFINTRSEACTPNEQRLAYSVREFFAGNYDGALAELNRVRALPSDAWIVQQASIIRSVINKESDDFTDALERLLEWHSRKAVSKSTRIPSEFYLSLPGLALSKLAVRRGVCSWDDLPQDNMFLPLDLIRC